MSFIVGIDGPAGSGKGTIAKNISDILDFIYVDTGAMYRCVTLYMLRNDIKPFEDEKISAFMKKIKIEQKKENGENKFFLDGEDVSKEIRTPEVSKFSSPYSQNQIIRDEMLNLQRKQGEGQNIVMEGRDICTVVFPNADVRIYLDATVEERAKRRVLQNKENGLETPYEEILEKIKERDYNDSNRKVAPLKYVEGEIYIDTTHMTIEEVTNKIINIIKEKYKE